MRKTIIFFFFLFNVYISNAQPTIAASVTDSSAASCNGICDGTATVSASGGSGTYIYTWNTTPVQTTSVATGLCAGTYSCTISDTICSPSGIELFVNGDFSSGNTGFTSSYTHTVPPNTAEGQYWVATGPQVSSWNGGMTPIPDHTSGTGNLMMINGSSTPNAAIWCQTISVNSNTTYLFSTWLSSVHASNPAQLQFSINGTPIGNIFTAPASTGIWAQFFTPWDSGNNTTANVCIINQNTNGFGNDFAIDDISFQECTPTNAVTVAVTIDEPEPVTIDTIPSVTLCQGETVILNAITSGGSGSYDYTWLPSGTGTNSSIAVTPASTTTYTVSAADTTGCISNTITTTVTVSGINAGFTQSADTIPVNTAVIFNNISSDADNYIWYFNNGTTSNMSNPSVTYTQAGEYTITLIASNNSGCADTTTSTIIVMPQVTAIATSCNNVCDGTAIISASDSTNTYLYSWNTTPVQNTPTATGLCAGSYTCIITDTVCSASGIELFVNGDFSAGNTGFTSSYTHTPPPNTASGQYWVATGPQVSSWNGGMTPIPDHTSGTGNLMMINGSSTPNEPIWCQTISISSNTTYLFSTWLSSIHASNPAQLQFSINGTPVGAIFTAPASTGIWAQFFTSWDSGNNTTANVCIVNQNTNGFGNDFAIDDISFQECTQAGPIAVTVTIQQPDSVTIDTIPSVTLCQGETATFNAITSGGSGSYNYTWFPAGTGTNSSIAVTPASTTTYTVSVTDTNGCVSNTITTTVTVANINAGFTQSADSGSVDLSIDFNNTSTGATGYLWDFGNTDTSVELNPNTIYNIPGTYTVVLIATNSFGCSDTASSHIIADDFSVVWIPNVFTPNGDGINDVFYVEATNLEIFNGKIFNRWGQLLFEWEDVSMGWDGKYKGKLVSDGVYVYIITATKKDGSLYDKIGHITVLD